MHDHVTFETGTYDRRAVLNSGWSDDMIQYLASNGIVELELNQAKGWEGNDLSFLSELVALKSFEIFDFNIKNVEPIHLLSNLRRLGVTTYCSTAIDFSAFPQLESCSLEWRPKATSLFDCVTLKQLFVNRYKGKDVVPFTRLVNLESLAILNAPVENLHGLSALKRLRSLRLANLKQLTSLVGIEGLVNLEELDINTCRGVSSIEEVGCLSRLLKLHLNNDGDIQSLKPLEKLDGLESVLFYESTNILDGDLSPLLRQKNWFVSRFKTFGITPAGERNLALLARGSQRPIATNCPDVAKRDPKSFEILRQWLANRGQHVSLRTGVGSLGDARGAFGVTSESVDVEGSESRIGNKWRITEVMRLLEWS
jgi:hypothetical protein